MAHGRDCRCSGCPDVKARAARASFGWFPSLAAVDAYYRLKLIVTVKITGTGTWFRRVGVYSHWRTASSAA